MSFTSCLQLFAFGNGKVSLENASFPSGLQLLAFVNGFMVSLEKVSCPAGLELLVLDNSFKESLENVNFTRGSRVPPWSSSSSRVAVECCYQQSVRSLWAVCWQFVSSLFAVCGQSVSFTIGLQLLGASGGGTHSRGPAVVFLSPCQGRTFCQAAQEAGAR